MRYLITGGAGFIGSHLADALLARGDDVAVLDDLSTGSERNLRHLLDRDAVRFVAGSALDDELVAKLVAEADAVFHLAATVGVKLVVRDPLAALRNNVEGTENVLRAAATTGAKTLVTSSSEIYGKNSGGRLPEDSDRIMGSPVKSRWAYATSKVVDEILAYEYWRQHQTPTVVVRLFNCSGPRQTGSYGMVIPGFVRQAVAGEDLTVYGDGRQTRCFCHVADAVDALLRLMDEDRATGQVFNVGSEREISIEDLARRVIELTGSTSGVVYRSYEEAYEPGFEDMQRRIPDTTRIRELTGWTPTRSLDDIIRDVVAFERSGAAARG